MCPLVGRRYYKWMLRANWMFTQAVADDREAVIEQFSSEASLRDLAGGLGILTNDTTGFGDYLDTLPQATRDELVGSVRTAVENEEDVFFDWAFATEHQLEVNQVPATEEQVGAVVVVVRAPFE